MDSTSAYVILIAQFLCPFVAFSLWPLCIKLKLTVFSPIHVWKRHLVISSFVGIFLSVSISFGLNVLKNDGIYPSKLSEIFYYGFNTAFLYLPAFLLLTYFLSKLANSFLIKAKSQTNNQPNANSEKSFPVLSANNTHDNQPTDPTTFFASNNPPIVHEYSGITYFLYFVISINLVIKLCDMIEVNGILALCLIPILTVLFIYYSKYLSLLFNLQKSICLIITILTLLPTPILLSYICSERRDIYLEDSIRNAIIVPYKITYDIELIEKAGSIGNDLSFSHSINNISFENGDTVKIYTRSPFTIKTQIIERDEIDDIGIAQSTESIDYNSRASITNKFVTTKVLVSETGGRNNSGAFATYKVVYKLQRVTDYDLISFINETPLYTYLFSDDNDSITDTELLVAFYITYLFIAFVLFRGLIIVLRYNHIQKQKKQQELQRQALIKQQELQRQALIKQQELQRQALIAEKQKQLEAEKRKQAKDAFVLNLIKCAIQKKQSHYRLTAELKNDTDISDLSSILLNISDYFDDIKLERYLGGYTYKALIQVAANIPSNISFDKGLPQDNISGSPYGSFTVYRSKNGSCYHSKKGCCSASIPIHIMRAQHQLRHCSKCCTASYQPPKWYIDYIEYQRQCYNLGIDLNAHI